MSFRDNRDFRGKLFCLFVVTEQETQFYLSKAGVEKKYSLAMNVLSRLSHTMKPSKLFFI